MEWMNWGGWRWIGLAGALAQGIWFGWTIRAINARADKAQARRAVEIVESLARCIDPRTAPNIDDELDAFAIFIREAKAVAGDLSEPSL